MGKVFTTTLAISGILASSLGKSIGKAKRKVNTLGEEMSKLNKQKSDIDNFKKFRSGIVATEVKIKEASRSLNVMKEAIKSTDKPSKKMLNSFKKKEKNLLKLTDTLTRQNSKLNDYKIKMGATGIVASNLISQEHKIAKALKLKNKQQALFNKLLNRQDKILLKREAMQKKLKVAGAMALSMLAPVTVAAQTQESEIRLSTVINAPSQPSPIESFSSRVYLRESQFPETVNILLFLTSKAVKSSLSFFVTST